MAGHMFTVHHIHLNNERETQMTHPADRRVFNPQLKQPMAFPDDELEQNAY